MREGDTVGAFTLGPLLGRGGMASVRLGTYGPDGTRVAIKVLRPEIARQPDFVTAFGHEVRATAGLNHSRITAIYDHGVVTETEAIGSPEYVGIPWLAMELVEGSTLRSVAGKLPWPQTKRVLLDVLDALAHAHARGLLHRDIKPGNVLFDEQTRRIKLTDFGLVHSVVDHQVDHWINTDEVSGTPAYMAPEQAQNRWFDFGPWTDLYAVGCMAWALTCGAAPYRGDVGTVFQKHLNGQLPDFLPTQPVPQGFLAWLQGMLDPNVTFRFQRAADARWHLAHLDDDAASDGPVPSPSAIPALNDLNTQVLTDDTQVLASTGDTSTQRAIQGSSTTVPLKAVPRSPLPVQIPPFPSEWRTTQRPRTHLHGAGLALFSLRTTGVVGREEERNRLWSLLQRVANRSHPHCVLIEGTEGSGTSTLARWLTVRADEIGGATWRLIRHSAEDGATDGLKGFLGWSLRVHDRSRADAIHAVQQHLNAIGMPHRDDAVALVEIARPTPLNQVGEGLSAQFESPEERLALLGRYFAALAAARPMVLWCDDFHHDDETMALADHLLDHHPDAPILIVMTTATEAIHQDPVRRERIASLVARSHTTRLELSPLDADGSIALIRELLGLDLVLASKVEQQCGGNPQFAVQLVSDWVERGLLVPSPSGFVLDRNADASIPSDMLTLWRQRVASALGGYEDNDLAGLELGAILGRDVSPQEWEDALRLGGVEVNHDLMSELQRQRLVIINPKTKGWSFVHALFRAAILESVEQNGRTQQWSSIAADIVPADAQNVGRRARFLLAANRTEEALDPLYRTIVRFSRLGEHARARHLLDVRRNMMKSVTVAPRSRHALGSAVAMAMVAERDGRYAVLQQHGAEYIEWAEECEDWPAVALLKLEFGNSFHALGQVEHSKAHIESALDVARTHRLPWVAAILNRMCFLAIRAGALDKAASHAREAVYAGELSGDMGDIGNAYSMLSRVAWQRGDNEQAQFFNAEATLRFEQSGSRLGLAEALNTEGEIARTRGDYEAAERAYIAASARYRRSGSTYFVYPEINLAVTYIATGRFAEAKPILLEVDPILQRTGREVISLVVQLWLTTCAGHDGDWATVQANLRTLGPALQRAAMFDSDIVRAGRAAAEQCAAAGQNESASMAWAIVVHQLDNLGRSDEADAIRDRATV